MMNTSMIQTKKMKKMKLRGNHMKKMTMIMMMIMKKMLKNLLKILLIMKMILKKMKKKKEEKKLILLIS